MLRTKKQHCLITGLTVLFLSLSFAFFPAAAQAADYRVSPGDTLWKIAAQFGVDVQSIRSANNLSGDLIYPGQVLYIPDGSAASEYAALQQQIRDYLAKEEGTYGIYFQDLITGHEFGINENRLLPAASTVKLPAVLLINSLVDRGILDWQEKLVYNPGLHYQGGSGILQFSVQYGNRFSLRTLCTMAITTSDNIAYNMLRHFVGLGTIADYMTAIGGQNVFPNGRNLNTARDMGAYVRAAVNMGRYSANGRRLLDDMANSVYNEGIPAMLPPGVTVAHKEGFIYGSTNDVGVVYGSRPFVVTFLSENVTDDLRGFENIARITRMIYDYQENL